MTAIPENTVTQEDLTAWYSAKKEAAAWKAKEMMLRLKIFRFYFPDPKEGTNTIVLPDTYQLKAVHGIDRKIVEEAMQAMTQRAPKPEGGFEPCILEKAGIAPDQLIKWKPEVAITYYRTLTAEQLLVADQMLIIKPGSPALDITPPSKKAPKP